MGGTEKSACIFCSAIRIPAKGTFQSAIEGALGCYAKALDLEGLKKSREPRSHKDAIASLTGCRVALASEVDKKEAFEEATDGFPRWGKRVSEALSERGAVRCRRRIDGKVVVVWQGVTLKEGDKPEASCAHMLPKTGICGTVAKKMPHMPRTNALLFTLILAAPCGLMNVGASRGVCFPFNPGLKGVGAGERQARRRWHHV